MINYKDKKNQHKKDAILKFFKQTVFKVFFLIAVDLHKVQQVQTVESTWSYRSNTPSYLRYSFRVHLQNTWGP